VLIQGTPVVLQASVTGLDPAGEVFLSWAKPRDLDTIPANGPYKYLIYRSDLDPFGNNLVLIDSILTANLNDLMSIPRRVKGGRQVGQDIIDRNRLGACVHPARTYHYRDALGEIPYHFERHAAGPSNDSCSKLGDRYF